MLNKMEEEGGICKCWLLNYTLRKRKKWKQIWTKIGRSVFGVMASVQQCSGEIEREAI